MKKFFSRNLIPLLFPVVIFGCEALERASHGDLIGATVSGTKSVMRVVEKYVDSEDQVNVSQEYYVGRGVAANVLSKYKRVEDEQLTQYVRKVGENVAKAARMTKAKGVDGDTLTDPFKGFFFIVLDDNLVNAFSAPGGFVFITRGALRAMKNEDELACVLGHEIGHIMDRHGVKYTLKQKKFSIPFEVASDEIAARSPELIGKYAKQFGGMCSDLAKQAAGGMGEEYELCADSLGAQFAAKAGYQPQALVEFIRRTRHGENLAK